MAKKKKSKFKKILPLIIILVVLITLSFILKITDNNQSTNTIKSSNVIKGMELPLIDQDDIIRYKRGYTLSYSPDHRQAFWVAYPLTDQSIYGTEKRQDNFHEDPTVPNPSTLEDYKRSGYDRGHLAPAADMNFSKEAMDDSFFMSNMSPQKPDFNRGIWSQLEQTVRNFADTEGVIYVVSGPIFKEGFNYKTIGKNKVTVPNYYFKGILKLGDDPKSIGFVLPNAKGKEDLKRYAKSIDDIEKLTNLDLFSNLDDEIENKVESSYNTNDWDFNEFHRNGKSKSVNFKTNNSFISKLRQANNYLIDILLAKLIYR